MEPVRSAPSGGVCLPEEGSAPSVPTTPYTVQRGDTLSKLAGRLIELGLPGPLEAVLRQVLALNPQVKDRDRILAGQVLQLPVAASLAGAVRQGGAEGHRVEAYVGAEVVASRLGPPAERGELSLMAGTLALTGGAGLPEAPRGASGRSGFSVSEDGTPRYKQGAGEKEGGWGRIRLNDGAPSSRTIGQAGCALTCVAMALSKLSGEVITPDVLDRYLDANGGYARGCNALNWAVAGGVTGGAVRVSRHSGWDLPRVEAELAAGRPVVVGVDYKAGSGGGANGTDHWLCLTRRDPDRPDVFFANDPATGEEVKLLRQPGGALVEVSLREGRAPYRTTGEWTSFGRAEAA